MLMPAPARRSGATLPAGRAQYQPRVVSQGRWVHLSTRDVVYRARAPTSATPRHPTTWGRIR